MENIEKIELNKKIRKYEGTNSFIISLQKQLKSSKHLGKIQVGKKSLRVLSENQYKSVKSILI
jgi:hypothetical protein